MTWGEGVVSVKKISMRAVPESHSRSIFRFLFIFLFFNIDQSCLTNSTFKNFFILCV